MSCEDAKFPSEPRGEPLMRVMGVSRHFDDGSVQALNQVSLDVARNEYLAIMGPSGSGKSTLLHLMGALDRPDKGEVYFRGESLQRLANLDRFRSQHLGFVFQSFHLMPTLTAQENVQIPMFEGALHHRERRARAVHLLESVGLSHRMNHYPRKLSVGERQRGRWQMSPSCCWLTSQRETWTLRRERSCWTCLIA
jgi:ABC-type lipoprotein export system ATPase subunit